MTKSPAFASGGLMAGDRIITTASSVFRNPPPGSPFTVQLRRRNNARLRSNAEMANAYYPQNSVEDR